MSCGLGLGLGTAGAKHGEEQQRVRQYCDWKSRVILAQSIVGL